MQNKKNRSEKKMNPYNASCGWSRGKKLMPITSCDSNQNCREQKFARSPPLLPFLNSYKDGWVYTL